MSAVRLLSVGLRLPGLICSVAPLLPPLACSIKLPPFACSTIACFPPGCLSVSTCQSGLAGSTGCHLGCCPSNLGSSASCLGCQFVWAVHCCLGWVGLGSGLLSACLPGSAWVACSPSVCLSVQGLVVCFCLLSGCLATLSGLPAVSGWVWACLLACLGWAWVWAVTGFRLGHSQRAGLGLGWAGLSAGLGWAGLAGLAHTQGCLAHCLSVLCHCCLSVCLSARSTSAVWVWLLGCHCLAWSMGLGLGWVTGVCCLGLHTWPPTVCLLLPSGPVWGSWASPGLPGPGVPGAVWVHPSGLSVCLHTSTWANSPANLGLSNWVKATPLLSVWVVGLFKVRSGVVCHCCCLRSMPGLPVCLLPVWLHSTGLPGLGCLSVWVRLLSVCLPVCQSPSGYWAGFKPPRSSTTSAVWATCCPLSAWLGWAFRQLGQFNCLGSVVCLGWVARQFVGLLRCLSVCLLGLGCLGWAGVHNCLGCSPLATTGCLGSHCLGLSGLGSHQLGLLSACCLAAGSGSVQQLGLGSASAPSITTSAVCH